MRPAHLRRGLALAALAAAAVLAGCASNAAEEAAAERARVAAEAAAAARRPPPIALNDSVAEAASVYVAFSRDVAAIEGGFSSPEAVQEALRRGSAYDPGQLSRGLVAYASILALQSPEFVAGVRQYAVDRTIREQLVANIVADPRWASSLPGADAAAGLIMGTLRNDIEALADAADSVENDAYAIQATWDPRRSWGTAQVRDREGRLAEAKMRSTGTMLPSAPDAARLLAAARSGGGLDITAGSRREGPYPAVVERALALAALAALGAAGDNARANTDALQAEPTSAACLEMSKLMLFQCLAASRPSYEDMFCLGRHVVRDIATCTRGAAMPPYRVIVSGVTAVGPAEPDEPRIKPTPLEPEATPAPPPAPRPPAITPAPLPTPQRPLSPTERLNTQPGG